MNEYDKFFKALNEYITNGRKRAIKNGYIDKIRKEIKNGTYTFYIMKCNAGEIIYFIQDKQGYISVLDNYLVEEYGIY